MQTNRIIQVEDKVPPRLLVPLSIQHMFAMFGASVLVPFMFDINPAIVLFMNGIGTLLFIFITKGKAPAYLGSSFAFIAPATLVIQNWGYPYALGGFVVVGLCGCVLAAVIYKCGTKWIDVVLPPAAMGPVVALIGLELAGSAASTGEIVGDGVTTASVITFCVTLGVAVLGSVLFRKFLSVIPILIAILCGYAAGLVTEYFAGERVILDGIIAAFHQPLFQLPNFQAPKFDLEAILIILPVILVIANEHIGHQLVTSKVVGRDLLRDPGLHRSLFADNFSTMLSGFIGSVPTTTYGENIGVMAITLFSVSFLATETISSASFFALSIVSCAMVCALISARRMPSSTPRYSSILSTSTFIFALSAAFSFCMEANSSATRSKNVSTDFMSYPPKTAFSKPIS